MSRLLTQFVFAVFAALFASSTFALDELHRQRGEEISRRAIEFLMTQQDETTGGWSVNPTGPDLPAISAIVLQGMQMQPNDAEETAIANGISYVLSFRREDGSIHDAVLPSYNTALAVSTLSKTEDGEHQAVIAGATSFLRDSQWAGQHDPHGAQVDEDHPYYGGMGYGAHSRPDLSNLAVALQALHDAGVPASDEAYQRALTFLQRTQMLDGVNDMSYANGSEQGGFIYSTSIDADHIGSGESKAGTIEETVGVGRAVSRLRCYGSMTYAGFKSYIYADLAADDPRVRAANDWIRRNYTVHENPGLGRQGYYYYVLTMSRALRAAGVDQVTPITTDSATGEAHDWANELIDRLAELQEEDGGFRVLNSRWMEDDRVLITAFALVAVQHALGRD